jgi:hypothetical protein
MCGSVWEKRVGKSRGGKERAMGRESEREREREPVIQLQNSQALKEIEISLITNN